MTTLITGGGSRTGVALARLLAQDGRPVLFTSRSGDVPEGFKFVKMDWYDASTYEAPFKADASIKTIYILGPDVDLNVDKAIIPFVDIALSKGVEKFIVLASTTPPIGQVLLKQHLEHKGAKYVRLRPDWYMDNFSGALGYSIREYNEFTTSVPTGALPFVATSDVAQAAYEAIIDDDYPFKDKFVIGPDNWTYDEAAKLLSEELGRTITHKTVSTNEHARLYATWGVPEEYGRMLAGLDVDVEAGDNAKYLEQARSDKRFHVGKVTLGEWIKANNDQLRPASNLL